MENFPELPKLVIPDNILIPAPPMDYPGVELLQFAPIFVPQTVQPGSILDLQEPQEQEDQEQQGDQSEQEQNQEKKESPGKEQNKETKNQQRQQNQGLLPGQTMPIEVPSFEEDEDDSFPVPEPKPKLEGVTSVQLYGVAIPMPEPEILVAAGATATVSVAATLASTSILKNVISVMKPIVKKIMTLALKKLGQNPPETKTWSRERLEQRHYKSLKKGLRGET